jgi:tripartite-type tricarboxylate transporter receptor subunit TctC
MAVNDSAEIAVTPRRSPGRELAVMAWAVTMLPMAAAARPVAYPAKLVRMVTGSLAGGGADITARQIATRLGEAFGQQVLVDNRPGVAGMLANELVAKAPADGYTLLLQPGGFITLSAHLNARSATSGSWETLKHLAPVIQVSSYAFVMALHPSVPAKSVKELIAVAKAKPRALNFVSSGVGSNFHLMGELFKLQAGVDIVHVAYRGSPPAIVDLLAGRGELMFIHVPPVLPYIRNGRLRALAVTGAARNPLLPEVPRMMDTLPGYEVVGSEGLLAPFHTPRDIVARVNAATAQVLVMPELKSAWADKAVAFEPNSPEQYAVKIREEYERTAQIIKQAGIKPEG